MNNTITLSQLITRLAKLTGVDNNTSRRFLKALFFAIEKNIAQGQKVTIKGVGTFYKNTDSLDSDAGVIFVPDDGLAAEINKPFGMFDPVELAADIDFDEDFDNQDKEETDQSELELDVPEQEQMELAVESHAADEETVNELPEETEVTQEITETKLSTPPAPLQDTLENDDVEQDNYQDEYEASQLDNNTQKKKNRKLWIAVACAIGAVAIVAYAAAVMLNPIPDYTNTDLPDESAEVQSTIVEEISVEELAPANTASAPTMPTETPAVQETARKSAPSVEPAPAAAQSSATPDPVYDTVEISLIRLAKKHYGVNEYWVYIFEANSDVIKNPNTIRPGTRVRIPDVSELPGNTKAETRRIASEKQSQILSRY